MKSQMLTHPKLRRLKRLLGLPFYQVVGLVEGLWQLAAEHAVDGNVGKFGVEELADWLEWGGEASELVEAFVSARLLDEIDGSLWVHDWEDHCPDYVKKRLEREQERQSRAAATGRKRQPVSDNGGQRRTMADNGGQRQPSAANGAPYPTQPNPTPPNLERESARATAVPFAPVDVLPPTGEPYDDSVVAACDRWLVFLGATADRRVSPDTVRAQLIEFRRRGREWSELPEVVAACIRDDKRQLFWDADRGPPRRVRGGPPNDGIAF